MRYRRNCSGFSRKNGLKSLVFLSGLVVRSQYCKAKSVRTFGLTISTILRILRRKRWNRKTAQCVGLVYKGYTATTTQNRSFGVVVVCQLACIITGYYN